MNWRDAPIGMTQHDELLDVAEAILTTHYHSTDGQPSADFVAGVVAVLTSRGLGPHLAARLEAQPAVRVEAPPMLRLGD